MGGDLAGVGDVVDVVGCCLEELCEGWLVGEADEVMTPYALFNLFPNAEVVAGGGDFITTGWC